jgi:hypothetical protein
MCSNLDSDTSSIVFDNQFDKDDHDADTMKESRILKLWIDGEIIPVKQSTLCICKELDITDNLQQCRMDEEKILYI